MHDISHYLLAVDSVLNELRVSITTPGENLAETTALALRLQEAADDVLLCAHREDCRQHIGGPA